MYLKISTDWPINIVIPTATPRVWLQNKQVYFCIKNVFKICNNKKQHFRATIKKECWNPSSGNIKEISHRIEHGV